MAMTVGLTGVTFATFARLAASDQQTMDKFYAFSIRIISLLTVPLFAFMIFNAQAVVNVLYSAQYLQATLLVQGILTFRIVARLFGGGENAEYLLSHGKVGTVVAVGIIAAMTNLVLNILLIPKLGGIGSVLASGCGNLLVNALAALAVYRSSPNRVQIVFWLKVVVASIGAAYLTSELLHENWGAWGNGLWMLALRSVLFGTLLGTALLILKPLRTEDVHWFGRLSRRVEPIIGRFASGKHSIASAES
jgi:O-antigen/teichoic acid export membrane protein